MLLYHVYLFFSYKISQTTQWVVSLRSHTDFVAGPQPVKILSATKSLRSEAKAVRLQMYALMENYVRNITAC